MSLTSDEENCATHSLKVDTAYYATKSFPNLVFKDVTFCVDVKMLGMALQMENVVFCCHTSLSLAHSAQYIEIRPLNTSPLYAVRTIMNYAIEAHVYSIIFIAGVAKTT